MIDMTYDPEADAAYIYFTRIGPGGVDHTEEAGPFIYDVDGEGRVLGIEILSASKVLAPGEWQNARRPSGDRKVHAAE
jgi:uncharacterized protein YuzE